MLLDLSGRTLASRHRAHATADDIRAQLRATGDHSVVLVLGDAIATSSWLDGFFAAVLDGETTVVLVSSLEDTIAHASFALRERQKAVLWCADLVALSAGALRPIGAVSEADSATFDVVARHGELLVEDVAATLGLTVPAAQQRLNGLIDLQLLVRQRMGRPYVYRLAAVDVPALEPA
jgi:hypothetical protein